MLGFKRSNDASNELVQSSQNEDVAKLFFDRFSNRLGSLETGLKQLSAEVDKLKASTDQSKLSDLVLLERLQKTEEILGESLTWIRELADAALRTPPSAQAPAVDTIPKAPAPVSILLPQQVTVQARPDPTVVQPGALNSITTPTEFQVLTLLANEGPKSAPEIGRFVGRSREHTARLMKKLFDEGYVRRDQSRIPFRYSTVERVKSSIATTIQHDQAQEVASAPQA